MENEMKRNSKLFYMIAEAIEEYPELHDQYSYVKGELTERLVAGRQVHCGTTQCIAGWALSFDARIEKMSQVAANHGLEDEYESFVEYGGANTVDAIAAGLLGLTLAEANTLFHTYENCLQWPQILRNIGDGMDVQDAIYEGTPYLR